MHPKRHDAEGDIRTGNAAFVADRTRNLDVKKEILASRPYPVVLWHWTEAEFVSFLDKHGFAPNTYRDRKAWRRQTVQVALASGQYVPQEVLNEEGMQEVIEDAIASVRSALAWEQFGESVQRKAALFEQFIGYTHSEEKFHQQTKDLVKSALRQGQRVQSNSLVVACPGWISGTVNLKSVDGRPPKRGPFGELDRGKPKTVRICDGSNPDTLWRLFSLQWHVVDQLFNELLSEGEVSLDQVWAFAGTEWIPRGAMSRKAPSNSHQVSRTA